MGVPNKARWLTLSKPRWSLRRHTGEAFEQKHATARWAPSVIGGPLGRRRQSAKRASESRRQHPALLREAKAIRLFRWTAKFFSLALTAGLA